MTCIECGGEVACRTCGRVFNCPDEGAKGANEQLTAQNGGADRERIVDARQTAEAEPDTLADRAKESLPERALAAIDCEEVWVKDVVLQQCANEITRLRSEAPREPDGWISVDPVDGTVWGVASAKKNPEGFVLNPECDRVPVYIGSAPRSSTAKGDFENHQPND